MYTKEELGIGYLCLFGILAILIYKIFVPTPTYDDTKFYFVKEVTIEQGSTLWQTMAQNASDKDNLQEMQYYALQDNKISDPGEIQPGEKVKIRLLKEEYR